MVLSKGVTLGHYQILGLLDAGGMGQVYRAHDPRLDRQVAIKVLPARTAGDPVALARFEREARAVAALSHPNILAIHDFGAGHTQPYAVMELLEGESLRQRLERGAMSWRQAAEIGAAVADGLGAAHAKGIIHRDLKPENIFLTRDGRVKILDFGLARSTGEGADPTRPPPTMQALSEPGIVLGTIGYMSPEQVRGEPVEAPTDVFALGCVLYEMVRGERAFGRAMPSETLAAIVIDDPRPLPPQSGSGAIPQGFELIVRRCLEKQPSRRFHSVNDLALGLRALLNETSGVAPARSRRAAKPKAIAVLPFANLAANPEMDYLSDGITESLINSLSEIQSLRVVPRSTAFRYKGRQDEEPATLGLALNVGTLLTGRIVAIGSILNVQAELVDVATESQLWGQQYKRQISDVFAVQEEISQEIVEALRVKLTGRQRRRLDRRRPTNPEAYQEFLRGRHHWNTWTAEGLAKAVAHFDRAIALDPGFAQAYAGLADAYGPMGYYGYLDPKLAFARAKAASLQALAIDPDLPEAHTTLGLAHLFSEWDWAAAESELRRAIQLNPRYPAAHMFYALFLSAVGQHGPAVTEARRAQELDPLSMLASTAVAWPLFFAGRFDEAIEHLRNVLQLDPSYSEARCLLVGLYDAKEEYAKAIEALGSTQQCHGIPGEVAVELKAALERGGPAAYWETRLALLDRLGAEGHRPPAYVSAYVLTRLGRHDEALRRLEEMVAERSPNAVFVRVDPMLAVLRADPRYRELERQLALPEPALP